MAKVKLSERVEYREILRYNLRVIKGCKGITNKKLGEILGVTGMTISNRLKHPEKLTAMEIYTICKFANVEAADFVSKKLVLM